LQIVDFAIFFSSTTIEECVIYNVPFIDFKVDPVLDRFAFLNHPSYSRIINNFAINFKTFKYYVNLITSPETKETRDKAFEDIKDKYLFQSIGVSGRILDYFGDAHNALVDKATEIYHKMKTIKELRDQTTEIELQKIEKSNPLLKKIYDRRKKVLEKLQQ